MAESEQCSPKVEEIFKKASPGFVYILNMPLYELFCLAKPRLGKAQLGEIIKLAGRSILDKGGVITDIKSFGEHRLAYEVRRPGEKYEEASMWQLTFAVNPKVLPEIDHSLRIDDRVLRWAVLKRQHLARLPNPFRIANAAKAVASTASPDQQ